MGSPKRESLADEWKRQGMFIKIAIVTGVFLALYAVIEGPPAQAKEKE